MNAPIHSNEWEILSAYLDGQLSDSEQRRVREMLQTNTDLQEGLEELRRTRAVLRAAPRRRVPRNFMLTPDMVRKPRPRFSWNWAPAFGVVSALATVLLVLTFALQFSTTGSRTASQPVAAPQAARDLSATQNGAPPVILWNGAPAGMGGGDSSGRGSGPAAESAPQSTPNALSAPATGQTAATPATGGAPVAPDVTTLPAIPPFSATVPAGSGEPTASTATAPRMAGVQPTATPAQAAKSASQAAATSDSTDTGGPILGIASTEERGKMVVPTLPQPDTYYVYGSEVPQENGFRTFQIILAVVALLAGLAGAILWWRTRH